MDKRDEPVARRGQSILARIRPASRGVEVGVFRGRLSRYLLEHEPTLNLVMVDIWDEPHPNQKRYESSGDHMATLPISARRECYHQAIWLTDFAPGRREIVQGASVEASFSYPNESFDFVFIDADHSYEGVREDIAAWYPKVAVGGWIGGHDIDYPNFPLWGVRRAVTELAETIRQPLELGDDYTWFVTKKSNAPLTQTDGTWDDLGPKLWAKLHEWAKAANLSTVKEWLDDYAQKIPCGDCKAHWFGLMANYPPCTASNGELFRWTVDIHNAVNRRLGKREMILDAAVKLWNGPPGAVIPVIQRESINKTLSAHDSAQTASIAEPVVERTTSIDCKHAGEVSPRLLVKCQMGLFGGSPHVAICRECRWRQPKESLGSNDGKAHSTTSAPETQPFGVDCHYARKGPRRGFVSCGLGLFGGTPHVAICHQCGNRHSNGSLFARIDAEKSPDTKPSVALTSTVARTTGRAEKSTRILLRSFLSPGDIVMLTAAVRELHRAHPKRFLTAVETSASDIWLNNPFVCKVDPTLGVWRRIDMHYPLINQSNQRPVHFIEGYAEYLADILGVRIPIAEFRGDIHLSDDEKQWTNQLVDRFGYQGRFWIIVAGGKYDFTAKWWSPESYQRVVSHFQGAIQFVQCGEKDHWHPPLKGVFNLVGQTSLRQFIRLIYHAEGVVCPVTLAMHLAAAVPTKSARLRPCVVIAGGREPAHWEAYPGHQFLHTIGSLPCCAIGGCWKSRCQPVSDEDSKNHLNLCERPVQIDENLRIPQCMAMIYPKDVVRAIERAQVFGN